MYGDSTHAVAADEELAVAAGPELAQLPADGQRRGGEGEDDGSQRHRQYDHRDQQSLHGCAVPLLLYLKNLHCLTAALLDKAGSALPTCAQSN